MNTDRRVAASFAIVAIVGLLASCSDQTGNVYLHFTNATVVAIEVVLLYPDTGHEFVMEQEIKPGTTSVTRSDVYPANVCSDRGILIARDADGVELARRTGRICKGDVWVIDGSGQPSWPQVPALYSTSRSSDIPAR
jgi:hypothetical protein